MVERLKKSSNLNSVSNSELRATPECSRVFRILYLISPVNIQSLSSVIEYLSVTAAYCKHKVCSLSFDLGEKTRSSC